MFDLLFWSLTMAFTPLALHLGMELIKAVTRSITRSPSRYLLKIEVCDGLAV
jgi:hypothetical protein